MRWLKVAAVVGLPFVPGHALSNSSMSLKDLVVYGLEHSPRMQSNRSKLTIAHNQVSNATAALLPKVDLALTSGIGETNPRAVITTGNEPYTSSLELKLTQPLYDNGRSWIQRDQSKVDEQAAELRAKSERDDYILELIQAYIAYSESQLESEARAEQLKVLDRQYRSISQQYRQGTSTKRDFSRIYAEVQRGEINQLTIRNQLEQAKSKLLSLVGYNTESKAPEAVSFALMQPDTKITSELPNTPPTASTYQHQIHKLEDQSADFTVQLERRKYWPQLDLSATAGYRAGDFIGPADTPIHQQDATYWNVMLAVNYTLWDWGTIRRNISNAELTKLDQTSQRRAALDTLERDIKDLRLELKQLQKSYDLSRELLKLEQETFKLLEGEYRQGRVGYLELVDSLQKVLESRISYNSAFFRLKRGILKNHYYEGKLYDVVMAP